MTRRCFNTMTTIPLARLHAAPARGKVAFCYRAAFDAKAVEWYSRFELLVTGAILNPQESLKLLARGCRLIAYEWSSGFYPGDAVSAHPAWQQEVLARGADWLISTQSVGGGAASQGKSALWYDFADPEVRNRRAEFLAGRLELNGYCGIFLDTLGFEQLPLAMQQAFRAKHPSVDYNKVQGEFLRTLRTKLGNRSIIFLNQGYRHANLFLPHADMDLTESYFTENLATTTRFRSWNDPAAPWQSIWTPMAQLVAPAARRFPRVRFVHLGYAAGSESLVQRAILYNFAAAKLWNHDAYLMMPQQELEMNDIYFQDLGAPLGERIHRNDTAQTAWRAFERGVVAINAGAAPVVIMDGRYQLPDPPRGYYFSH